MNREKIVRKRHRWIVPALLLGTAACVTDGPLAPRTAPQTLKADGSSDSRGVSGSSVLLRGKQRMTRPSPPLTYIVDGRAVPEDSLEQVDAASIISIEVEGGINETAIVDPRVPRVVLIRTRAGS